MAQDGGALQETRRRRLPAPEQALGQEVIRSRFVGPDGNCRQGSESGDGEYEVGALRQRDHEIQAKLRLSYQRRCNIGTRVAKFFS